MAITRLSNSSISTGVKYDSILANNIPVVNDFWLLTDDQSADGVECGVGVVVTSTGNIYAGYKTTNTKAGLVKYDLSGNRAFGKYVTGQIYENKNCIWVDPSENTSIAAFTYISAQGVNKNLILQFNSSGTLLANSYTNYSGDIYPYSVTKDSSGNSYYAHFVGGTGSTGFIQKVNSSYNSVWIKSFNVTGFSIRHLYFDSPSGYLYVCGQVTSGSRSSGMIMKIDQDANIIWSKSYDWSDYSQTFDSIKTDSNGVVYVVGQNNTDTTGLNYDPLVCKINQNTGAVIWNRTMQYNRRDYGTDVSIDNSGNVYIVGSTQRADGDRNGYSGYLAKFDSNGNLQWQRGMYTTAVYDNGHLNLTGVHVDPYSRFLVVTGSLPYSDSNTYFFLAKIPADGSKTGTYTVGSIQMTYASQNFTETSLTLTVADFTPSISTSTTTYTYSGAASNLALTQSKTNI